MQPVFTIILKSTVSAAILLAYYMVALRNQRLHAHSRWYLLAATALSLVIPFLDLQWYEVAKPQAPAAITLLEALSTGGGEAETEATGSVYATAGGVLAAVYIAISAVMLALLAYRILRVLIIARSHSASMMGKQQVVHTMLPNAPFSFMGRVYWNDNIDIESETGRRILQHELAHIRQHHTADKIFMELVLAICWINPIYWYIRHELANVHEFLADEQAVDEQDTATLAAMLLASHYKTGHHPVINPFFYSSIKRRIIMLSQTNKTRYALLRKALILPVIIAPVMLLSFTVHKETKEVIPATAKGMTLVLDAGHGGNDAGGVTGTVMEKELTIKICRKMAELAPQYNLSTMLTREGDEYPTLRERARMGSNVKKGMFISIHVNKQVKDISPANGWEIAVSGKNAREADSRLLASAIISKLSADGITPQLTSRGLAVLNENQLPAVLIECGYMDNALDMARLQDDRKLEAVCRDILNGVAAYVNATESSTK